MPRPTTAKRTRSEVSESARERQPGLALTDMKPVGQVRVGFLTWIRLDEGYDDEEQICSEEKDDDGQGGADG